VFESARSLVPRARFGVWTGEAAASTLVTSRSAGTGRRDPVWKSAYLCPSPARCLLSGSLKGVP